MEEIDSNSGDAVALCDLEFSFVLCKKREMLAARSAQFVLSFVAERTILSPCSKPDCITYVK